MGWAAVKARYDLLGTATQSTEDMVARRVLRAMGLTEKAFPRAERNLGTDQRRTDSTSLLERVKVYFAQAYEVTSRSWAFPAIRDVKSAKDAEHTLLDLVEQARDKHGTTLVYRVKGTDDIRTLTFLGSGGTLFGVDLVLPCLLRQTQDRKWLLADCDAQDYFNHVTGKDVKDGSAD